MKRPLTSSNTTGILAANTELTACFVESTVTILLIDLQVAVMPDFAVCGFLLQPSIHKSPTQVRLCLQYALDHA